MFCLLNACRLSSRVAFICVPLRRSKQEMCLEVNAALLIDDSVAYSSEVAVAGMGAFLFGEYPWNGGGSDSVDLHLPPGVLRAVSWAHVSELFKLMLLRTPDQMQCPHMPCASGNILPTINTLVPLRMIGTKLIVLFAPYCKYHAWSCLGVKGLLSQLCCRLPPRDILFRFACF